MVASHLQGLPGHSDLVKLYTSSSTSSVWAKIAVRTGKISSVNGSMMIAGLSVWNVMRLVSISFWQNFFEVVSGLQGTCPCLG